MHTVEGQSGARVSRETVNLSCAYPGEIQAAQVRHRAMLLKYIVSVGSICLCFSFVGLARAQEPTPPPPAASSTDAVPELKHRSGITPEAPKPIVKESIDLRVEKGTALQVALDREVRVQKVGQPIHGHIVASVYTFDKLVVPVGTEASGTITRIEEVSAGQRTLDALDANFTPARKIEVEFTELKLADGKQIPITCVVRPGSGQVLEFVTAAENKRKKGVKDAVTEKERQGKAEARRQFNEAMQQVKEPGKIHRLQRVAVAQLPVHPQYIDAGTMYFAELEKPLEFGSEPLTAEQAATIHTVIPPGSMVQARLMTPLSSASTQKGADVEAILSRPLLDGEKLILPQGTRLKGTVVQAEPARYWKHNGQLRFVFRDVVMPDGVESKVEAMMQGVQSGTGDNLKLDSEGGAQPTTPKARYVWTAVAVVLAAGAHEDEAFNRAQGGAGGFKVVGIVLGVVVKSQPFALAMGAFGAARSIYNNFIARGRDVVFAKHTAMEISVGTRGGAPAAGER